MQNKNEDIPFGIYNHVYIDQLQLIIIICKPLHRILLLKGPHDEGILSFKNWYFIFYVK